MLTENFVRGPVPISLYFLTTLFILIETSEEVSISVLDK
jgi:hypothetical protein